MTTVAPDAAAAAAARTPAEDGGADASAAAAADTPPAKPDKHQSYAECKVHGRKRAVDYLVDCGDGTYTCAGENECKIPTAHLREAPVVNWYYCECCLFVLNSLRQYSLHTRGGKHQHKVRELCGIYTRRGLVFEEPPARSVPEGTEKSAVLDMTPPRHIAEMHALVNSSSPRSAGQRKKETAAAVQLQSDAAAAATAAAAAAGADGSEASRNARKKQKKRREREKKAEQQQHGSLGVYGEGGAGSSNSNSRPSDEPSVPTSISEAATTVSCTTSRCEEPVQVVDLAMLDAAGSDIFQFDAPSFAEPATSSSPAPRTSVPPSSTAPVLYADYGSVSAGGGGGGGGGGASSQNSSFCLGDVGTKQVQSVGCIPDVVAAEADASLRLMGGGGAAAASAPVLPKTAEQRAAAAAAAAAATAATAAGGSADSAPVMQINPQHLEAAISASMASLDSLIANSIMLQNQQGMMGAGPQHPHPKQSAAAANQALYAQGTDLSPQAAQSLFGLSAVQAGSSGQDLLGSLPQAARSSSALPVAPFSFPAGQL